ncbi:MAG: ATP-dependent zinc metalloprotease FtsH [Candidatus Wallbacteria bacterium]|nr:ATP-dependent zinc metalloprotease FtsH [Candidatus Wallbacteria bacterium]
MDKAFKNMAFYLVLLLLCFLFYTRVIPPPERMDYTYSMFLKDLKANNVKLIVVSGQSIKIKLKNENTDAEHFNHEIFIPLMLFDAVSKDIQDYAKQGFIDIKTEEDPKRDWWAEVLINWFPMIVFIGIWVYMIRQMNGAGVKALSFGKSRAKMWTEKLKITFADVAGCDEAKAELVEVVDFLKDPQKFQRLGGKIPKGVLLVGPPGTGKTLLAKAVAGEADVPFFSISGSDFVEMFVGVGASRVRDLFEQGKKNAPCIIFIDEIDAVGRQRGTGLGGGHDEREQTLNALLVEMDGFEGKEGVILLSATNRPDVLDPALLRPGRFDREVVVDLPDLKGREKIFKVHTKNMPLGDDVDFEKLAGGTPGLTGADISNLTNEAALLAARKNHTRVQMLDFEEAKDKVLMGVEMKSRIINKQEKEVTAYHEAGHALVGCIQPDSDPVHKVTIIPRGRALGVTFHFPEEDKHMYSKEYFLATITMGLGGRVAEEIVFGKLYTGASNDLSRATTIAYKMVCVWGMSPNLGPRTFGKREETIFLGREIAQIKDFSENTATLIDKEVNEIINQCYQCAKEILTKNRDKLETIARRLLEIETVNRDELEEIVLGKKRVPKPETEKKDEASIDVQTPV